MHRPPILQGRLARRGLLAAIVLLAQLSRASATEVVPLSLEETVRQADAIVLGTVVSEQARWGDASQRWMVTDYTFDIEETLYDGGTVGSRRTVTLSYWGGTLDGETQTISDLRLPNLGERLLLMLRPGWQAGGFTPVVGFNQGLFAVAADPTAAVRDHNGEPVVQETGGEPMRRPQAAGVLPPAEITAPAFTAWLRSSVAAIKAKPSQLAASPSAASDSRIMPQVELVPELLGPTGVSPGAATSPATAPATETSAAPVPPAAGPPAREGFGDSQPMALQKFSTNHQAHLPIVVNQLPSNFSASPEDQYQMSKWNYYAATVFQVYATPTGTYGWGNSRFDLCGWPSSSDLQSIYGYSWDANTIAVTFLRYDGGGWITEADIAMNPAFSYTLDDEWVYSGSFAQGFRLVMIHELGHMHGLNHNFDYLSVMNYVPSVYRAFGIPYADDAQGVRVEYPGNAVGVTDLAIYMYYASGSQSVSDAAIPTTATAGGNLLVNYYHIENVGTTTISAPKVEWYLSSSRNYLGTYYYLGTITYSSLAPFTYFTPSTVQVSLPVPANITPGTYYLGAFIRDDGGTGQSGFPFSNNFAFSRQAITVTGSAPNNNFSDRIGISGVSGSTTGSNVGADKEAGEPNHYSAGGASVWWSWTAPASGSVSIDTFGSTFDTLLAVYTGSSLASLTQVASNDDDSSFQSRVVFQAQAGVTYSIAVDGYQGVSGSIQLNWQLASPAEIRIEPLTLAFDAAASPPPPGAGATAPRAPTSNPSRLVGMPANPNVITDVQPDGSTVHLYLRGGVDFHWLEDTAGYTVVRERGEYVYAQLDARGRLAPTSLALGKADPRAAGLRPGILPTVEVRRQLRVERQLGAPAEGSTAISPSGTVKNVVILMRFSNHTGRTLPSNANYNTLFNAVGGDPVIAPTGSVRDFYAENSYGAMTLSSTVFGWVTLPNTEQYYANHNSGLDTTIQQAITAALNLADPLINFSQFDQDGDGFVDSIAFVHSGYGAETGGTDADGTDSADRIWSHRWAIPTWTSAEGIKVRDYHINPGLWGTSGTAPTRIGVICHETGHFFGLPDLYDTDQSSEGIGSYCLMSNSWGFTGDQLHPPHFSAWSKSELGWLTPTLISAPGNYSLPRAETSPSAYKITDGYPSGEYLLIENRQPYGFESTMPQGGLAIWHIDENKGDNNSEGFPGQFGWPGNDRHYRVALLQADGLYNMEHGNNRGDGGDVYHANGVSEIGPDTTPSTDAYQGGVIIDNGNVIYSISAAGPTMTFSFSNDGIFGSGFRIFNDGGSDLHISSITAETSAPWIQWNPAAPFVIAAGESRFVSVSVNYALAPGGMSQTRLLVQSDDADESPYPAGVFVSVDVPNVCGDGTLQAPAEQCDDGDTASGDGCSSTCQIESGWSCPTPGSPCIRFTPTRTPTRTATRTATLTPTRTPTRTATSTPTRTPTRTATNTPSLTPTRTPTLTMTLTASRTPTRTPTSVSSLTPTRTPTATPTVTSTPTITTTPTPTVAVGMVLQSGISLLATPSPGRGCLSAALGAGPAVSAITAIITFDASKFAVESCTIDPQIGVGSGANKSLSLTALAPGSVKVEITGGASAIPTSEDLWVCTFLTLPGTAVGTYAVGSVVTAVDTGGHPIAGFSNAAQLRVVGCSGDCDGDGVVQIGEVIRAFNKFGGQALCYPDQPSQSCPAADSNCDGAVQIGEVVQSLSRFGQPCPAP